MQVGIFDLIGMAVIIIAITFFFVVGVLLGRKSKGRSETKALVVHFIFGSFAFLFLMLEQLTAVVLIPIFGTTSVFFAYPLAKLFGDIAIIISSMALIAVLNFAYQIIWPNSIKTLTVITALFASIYVALLLSDFIPIYNQEIVGLFQYSYVQHVGGYELIHHVFIQMGVLVILVPLMVIVPALFYYFAIKIRKGKSGRSKRSLIMAIALSFLTTAYLFELVGVNALASVLPQQITLSLLIVFRLFFIVDALMMYIAFSMPEWFKTAINWEE
ncbi:MAG: hypothetical protein ACTSRW_06835 [Candidatus Helarchaeota archaeon]